MNKIYTDKNNLNKKCISKNIDWVNARSNLTWLYINYKNNRKRIDSQFLNQFK